MAKRKPRHARLGGLRTVAALASVLFGLFGPPAAAGAGEAAADDAGVMTLSEPERAWLESRDGVTVGMMRSWPPFHIVDRAGAHSGITMDVFDLVNKRLGGKLRAVPGDWEDLLEAVKAGRLDAVMDLTPKPDREPFYTFTKPYLTVPHVIVARRGGARYEREDDLAGRTVALERGFGTVKFFRDNHPGVRVLEVADTAAALDAVSVGTADAYVGNRAVAAYIIQRDLMTNLAVQGRRKSGASVLAIGTRKDAPELSAILDKALASLTKPEWAALLEKYVDQGTRDALVNATRVKLTGVELAWLRTHPVVTVGNEIDWPPFDFAENGEPKGLTVDLIGKVAEKTGLKLKFVNGFAWSELVEKFNAGEVDVLPALYLTPERRKTMAFTSFYAANPSVLVVREDAPERTFPDSFKGKRIAIVAGFATADLLKERHPDIVLVPVRNVTEGLKAVSLRRVDGFVGSYGVITYILDTTVIPDLKITGEVYLKKPEETFLHMGVKKENTILLGILQKGLDAISKEEMRAIRRDWLPGIVSAEEKTVALTPTEQDWLERHRTIRLGDDFAWPPFTFLDEQGNFIGIASGYADLLSERLGVTFEPVRGLAWKQVLEKIKRGELDVLPAINKNEARETFLAFTKPYISFPVVIATRKDGPYVDGLGDLKELGVGVVGGYITQDYLSLNHPDLNLVPTKTLADGLDLLNQGKIDAFVGNLGGITYEKERLLLDDIKVAAPTEYRFELSFGVRKDWPQLVSILNKALDTIDDNERAAIKNTWMALEVSFGTDIRTIALWVAPFAASAIVIILIVVVWNRKLGEEVEERKRTQEELARSSEKLRGLTESLSKYLSPQVYKTIFSGERDVAVVTERKKLTVFFSDIKNFTATTEEMEPEDMTYLLNDYLTKMSEIALEHGGTIDKFIGDAVVVFFGDPETRGVKQDALAAVRMAVAMQRRMVDLRAKWADQGYKLPFHIRCGINTGYCNVGNFGSEQRMDYTIIGGQVNLAARLESICAPDGVTVSYETYSHIRDEFDGDPMEPILVKGIKEPVKPFAIRGVFSEWDEDERYIRRDDVPGLRLWVDLARLTEDQRDSAIGELEEALDIIKRRDISADRET